MLNRVIPPLLAGFAAALFVTGLLLALRLFFTLTAGISETTGVLMAVGAATSYALSVFLFAELLKVALGKRYPASSKRAVRTAIIVGNALPLFIALITL